MKNIYDDLTFFEEYGKMTRSIEGLKGAGEWHQLKEFFDDLENKTVLDLGCGYGWHSMYFASKGASHIEAIDDSEKMIEKAKTINNHININYQICNLLDYDYPLEKYDLVFSNLVLHYIEDLQNVYQKVYETLKHDGVFIFNIEHPTFTSGINEDFIYDETGTILYYPIDHYYYSGKRETLFLGHQVTKYHHTLTQILNGLMECGFKIEKIEEAMPEQNAPWYQAEMRRPMMLLVKARKG